MTQVARVVIVGSGGREHALARRLRCERDALTIDVIPGSSAIPESKMMNANPEAIVQYCQEHDIQLVIIGPEAPLAAGLADQLRAKYIPTCGPGQDAARLETDKSWAKQFMQRYNVATARWQSFRGVQAARAGLADWPQSCVIKYSGLAHGKGVFVCHTPMEAHTALDTCAQQFGDDAELIIEECLYGKELSYIVLTDGKTFRPLAYAQDHKRLNDHDRGPQTGGMGACAPILPEALGHFHQRVVSEIVEPTLAGLQEEQLDYRGFLYFGLMLTAEGPKLLEYNARLGDPEAQVILPTVREPLLPYLYATAMQHLTLFGPLTWNGQYCAGIVHTSASYPAVSDPEYPMSRTVPPDASAHVCFGTTMLKDGQYYAQSGRIFTAVGLGGTPDKALAAAYHLSQQWHFKGQHYRRDIGKNWHCPLPPIQPRRLVIMASGVGTNLKVILSQIANGVLNKQATVVAVIVDRECAAAAIARDAGITVHHIDFNTLGKEMFFFNLHQTLQFIAPDLVVLAGFMRVLPPFIVRTFRDRIVNIHPTDTRRYQGAHGYEWTWDQQLRDSHITVHLVDEGVDTGRIIAQMPIDLSGAENLDEVRQRGQAAEHRLYSPVIANYLQQLTEQGV